MFGINTYRKSEKLKIDQEMLDYRKEQYLRAEKVGKAVINDFQKYEHEYHHALELKGIELANLDATISERTMEVDMYKKLLDERDKEIMRLTEIAKLAVGGNSKNNSEININS